MSTGMAELRKMSARHKIAGPSWRPIGNAYTAALNVRRRTVTTITGLLRLVLALTALHRAEHYNYAQFKKHFKIRQLTNIVVKHQLKTKNK